MEAPVARLLVDVIPLRITYPAATSAADARAPTNSDCLLVVNSSLVRGRETIICTYVVWIHAEEVLEPGGA